jgi:hypothetical protein
MENSTQFISDSKGNIVSAIVPIEVYKQFLSVVNKTNNSDSIPEWHMSAVKERLESYESGNEDLVDYLCSSY